MISLIKLRKEANLLDAKWYILKAFLAVLTAYLIASNNPILKLDTISVLFGLMLTLEPVTITGIKNGIDQIYATLLGALSTAIIIYFFGINMWTIALSMAFTLYVCLKINWRAVSPVAIFTSIYMTQYVQKTLSGDPSILLTFRLRVFALGSGVVIAILFNFIFSLFSYRGMLYKRISFLMKAIIRNLNGTIEAVSSNSKDEAVKLKSTMPNTFIDIDWVWSLFEDIKKEYKYKTKVLGFKKEDIEKMSRIIMCLRSITHLNYDISYALTEINYLTNKSDAAKGKMRIELLNILEDLKALNEVFTNRIITEHFNEDIRYEAKNKDSSIHVADEQNARIYQDLEEIKKNISVIKKEIITINDLEIRSLSKIA